MFGAKSEIRAASSFARRAILSRESLEQSSRRHAKRLRGMPDRQESNILLPALHGADMGAINVHSYRHGFLAETSLQPEPAEICTK